MMENPASGTLARQGLGPGRHLAFTIRMVVAFWTAATGHLVRSTPSWESMSP